MNITKALANGGTIAVADMAMFSRPMTQALYDGLNLGASSIISDMIIPTADSLIPSSFQDIGNIAINAAVYAGIDMVTDACPFNTITGKLLYAVGCTCVGSNTVYPMIAMNSA